MKKIPALLVCIAALQSCAIMYYPEIRMDDVVDDISGIGVDFSKNTETDFSIETPE